MFEIPEWVWSRKDKPKGFYGYLPFAVNRFLWIAFIPIWFLYELLWGLTYFFNDVISPVKSKEARKIRNKSIRDGARERAKGNY